MDRIVARKNKNNLKASLYRLRELRSRPRVRAKANNKPLRSTEVLQRNRDHQRNVAILVVVDSKKKKQGEPTAQQIVSPMSLSSCDSNRSIDICCSHNRPRKHTLISPRKRVHFADDKQVVIDVSYKKSLSEEEKTKIWWTEREIHEFRKKASEHSVKRDQQEQEE
jgi:hypothetical protein